MSFSFATVFKSAVSRMSSVSSVLDERVDEFCNSVVDIFESNFQEQYEAEERAGLIVKIKACFEIFERDIPKVKRSSRAKTDGPKKVTSFQAFANYNRADVVAANPTALFGDISKILGDMWKELSEDEKAGWKAYAERPIPEDEKEEQARREQEEKAKKEIEKAAKLEARKAESEKNAHKRELQKIMEKVGFEEYVRNHRADILAQHPEVPMSEVSALLKKCWSEVDDKSKKVFYPLEEDAEEMLKAAKEAPKKELHSCENDGCTKKTKGDMKFDDKTVCSECHRKLTSKAKEEERLAEKAKKEQEKAAEKSKKDAEKAAEKVAAKAKKDAEKTKSPASAPVSPVVAPVVAPVKVVPFTAPAGENALVAAMKAASVKAPVASSVPVPKFAPSAPKAPVVAKSAPVSAPVSPVVAPVSTGFDFKKSAPVSINDATFWKCKGVRVEGVRHRYHDQTKLVVSLADNTAYPTPTLIGMIDNGESVVFSEMKEDKKYNDTIEWARKCGITIPDVEDLEDDLELDDLEDDLN